MNNRYSLNFMWDSEADVWIATSNDVLGLVLEDTSLYVLMYRVKQALPELLEMENRLTPETIIDYSLSKTESLAHHGCI